MRTLSIVKDGAVVWGEFWSPRSIGLHAPRN